MPQTPLVGVRVPEELERAARSRAPELEALDTTTLLRVGLAMLGGIADSIAEAIAMSRMRPGPRPRQPGGKAAA
jgi:hypothetical protein